MKFLFKNPSSEIIKRALSYAKIKDREEIRRILKTEQCGFCAYSERYITNTDSVDIEHFDPRQKNTDDDGYFNWYAVSSWMNSRKPKKIDPYLPILTPHSNHLNTRITYEDGMFIAVDNNDVEALNLIKFLGLNKPELYTDRKKHIDRVKELLALLDDNNSELLDYLSRYKSEMQYPTALEKELNLDLSKFIFKGAESE